ncbi:MAG TPA: HD-GYP domain-containing protein [Ktedonobacteraceae bacterium]|jgi:putative nucleotidyltransferase with HDIG domain|nr:HD-GYP domain-containing protein [Ktedonobacteraceae bacterium]
MSSHAIPVDSARNIEHEIQCRDLDIFTRLSPTLDMLPGDLVRHSRRVCSLTLSLARLLNLSEEEMLTVALAALLHDIGKADINHVILNKPGRLTPGEYALVQKHAEYGARRLDRFHSLKQIAPLVYHHHERWDGGGYPDGLRGETIPLGSRIIAIADAFDAMTTDRCYQSRRTPQAALTELRSGAGTQFDPYLVSLFAQEPSVSH